MHAFRSFRSKSAAPLTLAAAGLWASSTRFERRTVAEPAATTPPVSQQQTAQKTAHGEENRPLATTGDNGEESKNNKPLFPPPIGPMVAVFLDEPSVDKLRAHFPEARDGQLRRVVLQYGPSASEREMYRHLFSRKAVVTVTGDASSFARRALVASVSHAGRLVEPVSLSAAIDISPPDITDPGAPAVAEKDGPGLLASAALIEQVNKAGATKEDMWEGSLPPLLAHGRQFPTELGAYVRLKEPITVRGTICRADWVDGASISCRDTLEGGEKRPDDWEPSDCSICAFFSVSPCNGIFNRFVETSKRRDEYLKTFEPEEQEEGDGEEGEEIFQKEATEAKVNREGDDDKAADASVVTVGRGVETRDDRRTSAAPAEGQGRGENNSPVGKGKVGAVTGNAAKDSRDRQAERDLIEEQLDKEATVIFNEMKECMIFHDLY